MCTKPIFIHKRLFQVMFGLLLPHLFCTASLSQDILTSDLAWQADQVTDLETQKVIAYNGTFKTRGTEKVEWIQKKGQMTASYNVTGTEGMWRDISVNGSITYLLNRNGKTSKLTLEKNSSGTFITFDFSKQGEYTSQQRFRIQSVQRIN